MFGFGSNKGVPEKVRKAGLGDWYGSLSDQNRVRMGRYIDRAEAGSAGPFLASVCRLAAEDHNWKFLAEIAPSFDGLGIAGAELYFLRESAIEGLYMAEQYDLCERFCDEDMGLLLNDDEVREKELARGNGNDFPENIPCRNFKLNVLVGVRYDYEAADRLLDFYGENGLIPPEDVVYRKNSIRNFRMQRTFDNVFNVTEKQE
ncbi:hypothetical protein AUQ37_02510 [Candidatus Methanomethylophilus sp. 1R26]|uniref:hypothetical protein n=1 Tax=Candidatus Methanomethylophilus sp. 1R26 TaxID=1769296 RepID=UPI0007360415|nr:hypothetical protein [Candidatus Methanomethylophilus sp. 1R26]KUE73319.1 hypothetical protein AUQ37_02510 [Candidatus Methanomethylophilus sp. 1R26]